MSDGYLLLVEDDPTIQANNKKILARRGYAIRQAFSLAEARKHVEEEPPRAIVLDVQLPDGIGLDFLQELRKTMDIPVLMLTARGTPQDIIQGLESGGDDYLTKPYDLSIFVMRVEALLRRASIIPNALVVGPIRLEPSSAKAYINGEDMVLSQKEYALLQQFVQHPDRIYDAEQLYEKVWGQKMLEDDTSLKVAISKLRGKLAESGYTITASRGEGYYLEQS